MGVSEHVRRLRAAVGHELLLLPSVSLLITDESGRLLLVRHAGHDDGWAVPGGAVEIGESPAEAAVREASEEIGVAIHLRRLVAALGGPDFEVSYPNEDRTAYVTAVYEAQIVAGVPAADHDELSEVAWFTTDELRRLELSRFTRALLMATGYRHGDWPQS